MRSPTQEQSTGDEHVPKKVPTGGVAFAAGALVAVSAFSWWALSYVICQGSLAGLAGEGPCTPYDAALPIFTIPAAAIGGAVAWRRQRWLPLLLGAGITFAPLIAFIVLVG